MKIISITQAPESSPRAHPIANRSDAPRIVATSAIRGPGSCLADLQPDHHAHQPKHDPQTPTSQPTDEEPMFCYV